MDDLPFRKLGKGLFYLLITVWLLSLSFMTMAKQVEQKQYTLLGLGDSITEGGANFISYLYPLWKKLFVGGYQVEFIGPRQASTKIGGINHAGYSGMNAEYLAANIDSVYSEFPADIVLLHAGHNHFADENPIGGIVSAQEEIVRKIKAVNPEAIILLAKVIESGKLPKYSYIPDLNRQLDGLTKRLQKRYTGIYPVHQQKKFDWHRDTIEDKVHPNEIGAEKMAETWFNTLEKVLDMPVQRYNPEVFRYKGTSDKPLELHVFKPPGKFEKQGKSCIVLFFGGGWKVGSPLQFYREATYFASLGMVAITADYRTEFVNGTSVFESISDAKSSIRWIRANASKLGIDPHKIAAAGASSGGYLAAATATVAGFNAPHEDLSISPKPNLNLLYYPVLDNGPEGYGSEEMRARFREVSPMYQKGDYPATLILLGTEDPYLSVDKAEKYRSLLDAKGVVCEVKLYEGAGYPIFYYRKGYSPDYFRMLSDSENFLRKQGFLN